MDPLGGWSGDMFAAALLDAFPEHWPAVEAAVASLDLGPSAACRVVPHRDGAGLTGARFTVAAEGAPPSDGEHGRDHALSPHAHAPHAHGAHGHDDDGAGDGVRDQAGPHRHRAWLDIREMLAHAGLASPVLEHAVGIFKLLARAEAEVHGVSEEAVAFHEVGAVDSIVDIVAAAQLLALIGPAAWTSAPLPLGSGRVRTQHGILPVPAPATALLLRGLTTIDDGIPGERVTPTGAAIARYLLLGEPPARTPRRLLRTGTGFGSREMPGISNCLRALVFEPEPALEGGGEAGFTHRDLGVITFEVDDLSAEDLATGLDHIRALPGIHDVIQAVAFGKKGRVATQVQVLVAPPALDRAIAACFTETTTIGLRFHRVQGAALRRVSGSVEVEGRSIGVKLVARPGGVVTAKAEASDVAARAGHAARVRLRRDAEATAVEREGHGLAAARPGIPS